MTRSATWSHSGSDCSPHDGWGLASARSRHDGTRRYCGLSVCLIYAGALVVAVAFISDHFKELLLPIDNGASLSAMTKNGSVTDLHLPKPFITTAYILQSDSNSVLHCAVMGMLAGRLDAAALEALYKVAAKKGVRTDIVNLDGKTAAELASATVAKVRAQRALVVPAPASLCAQHILF